MPADDLVKTVGESLFEGELRNVDPMIDDLIQWEEERQARRLILIPSESLCHPVVRRTMASVYGNLYAEGYPSSQVTFLNEQQLSDVPFQLEIYRRYADRRFYKGTDYINFVESLCKRRAAEAFANENATADEIFANVQALSGAAANLAVYEAFLKPGDRILSMDLMHGGHLSHGSEFHMSGRRYEIVPYGISPKSGLLDYDEIERLAHETQPRLILAGYTSYPWAPDWKRFREIADEVGALLMADISHPAGMAIAGAYPNPVGIADVTTCTTHKTLMGPRGALILTTDEDKANQVDLAVFPGEQGGPHINSITALAVALKLAKTEKFQKVQHRIVENTAHFAQALTDAGLGLAYGGTDTHLLLIDLKKLPRATDEVLRGEMAVRLLEICGIVANKNTIPGDDLTAMATGVRMGTPWLTQRGITKEQLTRLAQSIAELLLAMRPFHYDGLTGALPRAKLDFPTLEKVKRDVAALADELADKPGNKSGYPHYHFADTLAMEDACTSDIEKAKNNIALFDHPGGLIRVTGPRVEAHMQNLVTSDLSDLACGQTMRTLMLDGDGRILDRVVVSRLSSRDDGRDNGFYVLPNAERAHTILSWMRGHADGYLLFEPNDITAKVEGPVVVEDLASVEAPPEQRMALLELVGPRTIELGLRHCAESGCVNAITDEDAAYLLLPLSEKEDAVKRLVSDGAVPCGLGCRPKVLENAGFSPAPENVAALLKAGETHWFAPHKPYFIGQNLVKDAIPAPERPDFVFRADAEPELRRTTLYEEHKKLTKKLVPFAGWEMPVWYAGTMEEHRAVRRAAGLFDVSHMGSFEVSGENATDFLDVLSTNYARWIGDGESYYSYLLDPKGDVIDDIMVYRLSRTRYQVVVNASNEDLDWAWFNAVNEGQVCIDPHNPHRRVLKPAVLRNLKDPAHGEDRRVLLAIQGRVSREVLARLMDADEARRLRNLRRTACGDFTLNGLPVVLSRTGYTGESFGYEIFVHPDRAPELWRALLETGEPLGLVPAGLGARDSLRTEFGLPLYGHELQGDYGITPAGAGFPSYVKLHKPFFIGKQALMEKEAKRDKICVRFRVPEKGLRPLRPGDPVASPRGDFIGNVTSSVIDGEGFQVGLAYVFIKAAKEGPVVIFPLPPEGRRKGIVSVPDLEDKTKTVLPVEAQVISRFMEREED